MPELLVMRHAKSDWRSSARSDFDRPLARRGHDAAERMAEWLSEHDLEPDRILSSSAVRAAATAGYVADRFGLEVHTDDDLYLASSWAWFETLRRESCERLLICGHNPGLDDLVELLADERPSPTAAGKLMTTAAVAHFSLAGPWAHIDPGAGRLLSLVRPREL